MKNFVLIRDEDESGVSGTGFVGWAVEFPHGLTVVTFRDDLDSTADGVRSAAVYQSLKDAVQIHGHGGKTRFVELDVDVASGGYEAGIMTFAMDQMENVPYASIGGLDKRAAPVVSAEKPAGWLCGYLSQARRCDGKDWRTCSYGWAPALMLNEKPLGPHCVYCGGRHAADAECPRCEMYECVRHSRAHCSEHGWDLCSEHFVGHEDCEP